MALGGMRVHGCILCPTCGKACPLCKPEQHKHMEINRMSTLCTGWCGKRTKHRTHTTKEPLETPSELDEALFKLRTTREVEHNDNQWTTEFVYTLDEAKVAIERLIAEEVLKAIEHYFCIPKSELKKAVRDYKLKGANQ